MANEIEDWKQKAGSVLPPCAIGTETCNRVHGKCNDNQSSEGYSYFFKVMLGDFAQKLRIPPAFVHMLSNETDEDIALEGPTGHQWLITLWRASAEMEFREGWGRFVSDQRIELGDFLVFKYICRSHFQVKIFGRSGCEKKVTVCESEKNHSDLQYKRSPATPSTGNVNWSFHQPIKSKVPIRLVFGEEEKNVQAGAVPKAKSSSRGERKKNVRRGQPIVAGKKHSTPKSAGPETEQKSYVGAYYVSCRRPVTEAEKNKAVQEANSFASDNPFHLLVMRPSNVYQGFWLNIPRVCGDRLRLPRQRTELTLVDPNNKEWDVKYLGDRSRPGLSGGWKYLSIDNNLEQDDVCILERIDESKIKFKIRVHIYRVVKICTPYKRMEGKGISDSIALPKKHSKKKMKVSREGFAFYSSAKVVKHKQVKKEKASSGSNFHKRAESKCTPSKSERKADYKKSPRPNGICNLLGSPKELMYSALSANGQQSVGWDTIILSKKTASLDDFNGDDKKGMEIVWHSDAATHTMPPNNVALIPSQESMLEGPLINSIIPVPYLEYEAQLSPEAATSLVDMNDEENCRTVSG
ncbi:hypothetical protein SUGI_0774280 [Cryptomeria japonica]|uniref:B3 domain-containing protein Os11g0197600 n=1 Tax=Cryptomeria japonica TaxID=3369 RepID=UPI0024146CBE|nr:B3 domain-containing protein Os11g0197600 [Cryptomeria japonica]GLJ38031.1 hypothetical protein SUGI_0774280 [Cryptomeria japonica]